jgi:dolichyl-phosphate beta-glucosyltransferase
MSGRICIVVPCFDEGERLDRGAFAAYVRAVSDVDFVLVDDGSRDGTPGILRGLAEEAPDRFRVVTLERNLGKAEAVRRGMREALGGGAELAGYWDADLAAPLDEIGQLAAALRADPALLAVLGSRVQLLGREIVRSPVRHYAGRVFATLASLTLGLPVYDTQCGAKLFRNVEAVRGLFEEPFGVGWTFDVELLARVVAARRGSSAGTGAALAEVPLRSWRDPGRSKVRALDFFRAMWELARIRRRYFGR